MEARVVSDLQNKFQRARLQQFADLINNNPCLETPSIARQICDLLLGKLIENETPSTFDALTNNNGVFQLV